MCSVNSCYDEIKPDRCGNLVGSLCRKCNEKPAKIALQRKFPYCRECFLLYLSHKYSGGLGKSKLLRNGDNVLVAFSGSPYSVCLLDLIFRSLIEDRKKKTRFGVVVIFIDERFSVSIEERCELYKCIKYLLSHYEYQFYYTTLFPGSDDIVLLKDLDLDNAFNNAGDLLFSDIKSDSYQQDLILKFRNDVLFRAAKKLGCNKIFSAETSDHIASSILSNLALGRGQQLPSITGMVDKRNDILLVRPLRECSKKEVVFYNVFNKLDFYNFSRNFEKEKFSSIQKLSECFIMELLNSFPSTVSTVVSTGNKLFLNCNDGDAICILCQSTLDPEANQLSALDALKISNFVSNLGPEALAITDFTSIENGNHEELKNSLQSYDKGNSDLTGESLSHLLCHSCREILKEAKSLKSYMLKDRLFQIHKNIQDKRMHSEIKDFLLE